MAQPLEDFSINSLVGPGSAVSGDIRIAGFARVDGDVDGNLEATGNLIVGEKARIRGSVTALSAFIGGIVQGDVTAPEQVRLFPTSIVFGDIITRRIEIAEDVVFHGRCVSLRDPEEFEAARGGLASAKAIAARAAEAARGGR